MLSIFRNLAICLHPSRYKRMNELTLLIHSAICWPFPSKKKKKTTVIDASFFNELDCLTYSCFVLFCFVIYLFSNIAWFERSLTRVAVKGFLKYVLQGLILTGVLGKEWLIVHSVCNPFPPPRPTTTYTHTHTLITAQLSYNKKNKAASLCQVIFAETKQWLFLYKHFFSSVSPPLSRGLMLLNFNIWSLNRCSLAFCTPWTKTELHP